MNQLQSTRTLPIRNWLALGGLLLALTGCASAWQGQPPASAPPIADTTLPAVNDIYAVSSHAPTANVVRTGRYQLVALAPSSGQRDLLRQLVSIDLPQPMQLTVRDGLTHVLRDSGLQLCPRLAQTGFFATALPAVHHQLGPTTLSDALQVLAGPAWRLSVDFNRRTVCFVPRHPDTAIAGRTAPSSADTEPTE